MTKHTPIKRAKELVLLSQEHHHALVFCVRLKKTHLTDIKTLQLFVNDFWINNTATHFENEETWLLPEISDITIKNRFLSEHQQIKDLVKSIKDNDGDTYKNALELATVLHDHVRFEEKIMFPYLEQQLDNETKEKIGKALAEFSVSCQKFTPEFWKK